MEGENGQPPDTLANDFAPRRCSFRCSPTPPPKTGGARWCVTFQNASQCSLAHPFLPLGRAHHLTWLPDLVVSRGQTKKITLAHLFRVFSSIS